MFDNVCRYLAEQFSPDLASWLIGQPVALTKLSPTELSLEPIRADALILLQSDTLVLQVEFQTQPDESMAFRLADYRLRVYRRFPDKQMYQVVVYLRRSRSPLVYQTRFELPGTRRGSCFPPSHGGKVCRMSLMSFVYGRSQRSAFYKFLACCPLLC